MPTDDRTSFTLRFDPQILTAIDDRRKANGLNLSRNEWLERAARWVLTELPYSRTEAERKKLTSTLLAAPADVRGDAKFDLGPEF